MKNLYLILVLIFTLSCQAQSPVISTVTFEQSDDLELTEGCYLKDVENKFQPFIGIWKWIDGNSSLEIEFQKIESVYNDDYYADMLVGKYKYTNSANEVKHNSLNIVVTNQNFWANSYHLISGSGYYTDTTFRLTLTDIQKNIHCYLDFKLLPGNQAQWKIQRQDGFRQTDGFTFPKELTLTKQ